MMSAFLYFADVSFVLHPRSVQELEMSFEEKNAWVMGLVAVVSYAVYVAVVFGMAGSTPLTEVPYVAPLLWTVGGSIAAYRRGFQPW
jgi:hypothetical protein